MSEGLFERVRLAREGADVERCHTYPHSQRYSVGHHSLGIVTLLTLCWQKDHAGELPRSNLLIAAAFHDIPERIVGDVPQPIKVLLAGKLDEAEDRVLTWLGVNVELTEEEQWWLKSADKVELYLWSLEEAWERGFPYFVQWAKDYDGFFDKNPAPLALFEVMVWAKTNYGKRIDFTRLKEIAGL
jgi:5'-deoxynucleotidase YfbR-like HD superfamily hydrolase